MLLAVSFCCPSSMPQGMLFQLGSVPHGQKVAFQAMSCISSWVAQVGVKRSVLHTSSELCFCRAQGPEEGWKGHSQQCKLILSRDQMHLSSTE